MTLSIHASFLPSDDLEASLSFYRDILGFEVRDEGALRVTVGPPGQPGTSLVLHSPVADPEITAEERATIAELMAKGSYATVVLSTRDLIATFDRIQATGADVVQEPLDQPWGVRDCAFRDPAGTLVRIEQR
ncbi:VOC family protein [Amycolatopsis umgeniensis]|uniref:Catechol 2,3-dioxygenase-like lactoylglutathione lyase family enzyme n=1 Tax=Amycolatopsis umgeniensis TaxID=336628 RepID=A0A841AXC3_9PSEU|nr:VOC family protein [Amycolatopsis umgeniensis]MBB5850934.1 catechol 2,3-dioxygenase-like lactoylglutathione lyase family enzyme [Amycolatopsis umgeniensis]